MQSALGISPVSDFPGLLGIPNLQNPGSGSFQQSLQPGLQNNSYQSQNLGLGMDVPMLNSGRRMRSGSLFSTHSIWNDDAISAHSPLLGLGSFLDFHELALGSNPGSSFLSPTLGAQPLLIGMANPTRNRSHTTNGATLASNMLDSGRLSLSPFLNPVKADASLLLDNLVLNMPEGGRNRSQTYSGVASIPEIPVNSTMLHHQHLQNLQNHQMDYVGYYQPFLQNDFDFSKVVITTNFENPSLGPTSTLLLDNVPQFVDAAKLFQLLNGSGSNPGHGRGILGVRVSPTTTSKMALVECPSIEVAMGLKASFNHLEIIPGIILYVAFAKLEKYQQPPIQDIPVAPQKSPVAPITNGGSLPAPLVSAFKLESGPRDSSTIGTSLVSIVARLSTLSSIDLNKVKSIIRVAASFNKEKYQKNFGPLPDPIPLRQFDSPKLRELRKVLESNEKLLAGGQSADDDTKLITQLEVEELCLAMLDELPELCYDHIGNTIVQKIFTVVKSPLVRLMMVKEITPYLTQLSIHKNGTWAIQKIINLCHNDLQQKSLIAASLKPYSVKLFNDQFGNYVLQCCLKFGSPYNDFIFETMLDNFLEISYGRFGARCIRTILETSNDPKSPTKSVSNEQTFLIAGLIVEYANELVVNNNGSLLITWFLDTFNGCRHLQHDYRYELLCIKFMPHLEKLCVHKLANLTIFKLLNNRSDQQVKHKLMDTLFGPFHDTEESMLRPPSKLLETILAENQEHNAGPLFVYKILSNPVLFAIGDEHTSGRYQQFVTNQVKRVLLEMNILNLQPYKKLVDEVGLSTSRLNRSPSGNRKGKRGGRGKNHSPHHQSAQPLMMPQQGYQNGQNYNYQYNDGTENSQYQYQQYFQQDMTVMQQLEQLSLSSAALGYTSNPGTPNPTSQRNLFF